MARTFGDLVKSQWVGMLALLLVLTYSVAQAAGALNLGAANVADRTTSLRNRGDGPALALVSKRGQPAISVSSPALIRRLNAERLNGHHSTDFAPAEGSPNYVSVGSVYTKAQVDAFFARSGSSYTKTESDGRYAPKRGSTNYAPAAGSPNYAPASGSPNYAPAEGSTHYVSVGSVYTKAQADAFFLKTGTAYTKTEADGRYAPATGSPNYAPASGSPNYAPVSGSPNYVATGTVYTKAQVDALFAPATGSPSYAPASGSPNYAPASGSPNYAPTTGSPNYAPASGSPNYLNAADFRAIASGYFALSTTGETLSSQSLTMPAGGKLLLIVSGVCQGLDASNTANLNLHMAGVDAMSPTFNSGGTIGCQFAMEHSFGAGTTLTVSADWTKVGTASLSGVSAIVFFEPS